MPLRKGDLTGHLDVQLTIHTKHGGIDSIHSVDINQIMALNKGYSWESIVDLKFVNNILFNDKLHFSL